MVKLRWSPEGGISIDPEVPCGCVEVQTDSAALILSVPGVSLQFVGAFLPPLEK